MTNLTHFNDQGHAIMVDVGHKDITQREAIARGLIQMKPETYQAITNNRIQKGDVFAVARLAGIMAAKKTSDLIPLCHPLPLTAVSVEFCPLDDGYSIEIEACCRTDGKTGVEMEALTAVNIAALTIYDMCKAVDRAMVITNIRLHKKSGGKSGLYQEVL